MARRKKHEEHENLERWLLSYSDFITLLFATFVVLYALSQVDISEFSKLESALREAFSSSPTVMEGKEGILDDNAAMLEGGANSPTINPIILEFISQKYETSSFEELKKDVDNMKMDGVKAEIDEKGLVLKIDDRALTFAPNSAQMDANSIPLLNQLGSMIAKKFQIHIIKVEGHTDSDPISSVFYPSNWELSSARAAFVVNFFIRNNKITPKLLIAAGYADTAPVAPNNSSANRAKNRRVEIVVLRNKLGKMEGKDLQSILNQKTRELPPGVNKVIDKRPVDELYIPTAKVDVGSGKVYSPEYVEDIYVKESARIKESTAADIPKKGHRPGFMTGE